MLAVVVISTRKSRLWQLGGLIFAICFIAILTKQYVLINSGNHTPVEVLKDKTELLHLLNDTSRSGPVIWKENKIFIGKTADFGINFIRIKPAEDTFLYTGDDLNLEQLSKYCSTIAWRDCGGGVFEAKYLNLAEFRQKTKVGLLILLSLFAAISLWTTTNLVKIEFSRNASGNNPAKEL